MLSVRCCVRSHFFFPSVRHVRCCYFSFLIRRKTSRLRLFRLSYLKTGTDNMMLRLKKTRPHNHMEKLVDALVKDERRSQSVKALKCARQMIILGWKVAICLHRPGPAGRTRLGVSRHVEDKCPNAHRYALYHESRYLWSVLKPKPPHQCVFTARSSFRYPSYSSAHRRSRNGVSRPSFALDPSTSSLQAQYSPRRISAYAA